ncbi:MAG: hypothetical protein HYZ37_11630 [Candidatus Solibacter usitatus]|nr:hypothetical protein [Candidatus Solibacter usitatus]
MYLIRIAAIFLSLPQLGLAQFGDTLRMMWSHGTCAGTGPSRYTVSPMDPADVSSYLPLGLMVDAHVTPIDHVYFSPRNSALGRDAYAVRAPADGVIVHIQRRMQFVGDSSIVRGPTDEFRVVMEHSCSFWTYFDLITSLDPVIVEAMGGLRETQQPVLVRIPVTAGQTIGRIGGQTLDMGTVNAETALPGLLVPEHYAAEPWKVHTVDPLDYFDPAIREALLALNARQVEPRGGRIDYDVDGQLVGNWFREGSNWYRGIEQSYYWAGHFSAAYHYMDPSKIVISIGDFQGRSRQFFVTDNGPDPTQIGVDTGPVKYELLLNGPGGLQRQGVLLVQLLEGRKLQLEVFPQKIPSEVDGFTEAARIYLR